MSKPKNPTGTREWSTSSANVMLGCPHDCVYCYARASAIRFKRVEPLAWKDEQVVPKLAAKNFGKRAGTIMFPTSHDISPDHYATTSGVLRKMLAAGNDVLVVSKPHLQVIRDLCTDFEQYKSQILFRFSIGSMHDATLMLWEPGAPPYSERFESLMIAHEAGFATSVSMEPLLETDEDDIVHMVRALTPWVTDSIWVGKINKLKERLRCNGFATDTYMTAADVLLASQTDERILALYARLKSHDGVKWKESIKQVVGIETPAEIGMDV